MSNGSGGSPRVVLNECNDELLVSRIEVVSGTICETPDVFERVPIARPVPTLTRSPRSKRWIVNMFICFAVCFKALKTTKCLNEQSLIKEKEKANTTILHHRITLQEPGVALLRGGSRVPW